MQLFFYWNDIVSMDSYIKIISAVKFEMNMSA